MYVPPLHPRQEHQHILLALAELSLVIVELVIYAMWGHIA